MSAPIPGPGLAEGVLVGGDFRVVRPLDRGGMGAVYVAEQRSTGAMRALKTMHAQLADDPKLRRRFEQEARVGAKIDSDHVVAVVAAGIDDALGVPWLAMELLEGENLDAHVARVGMVAPDVAAELFAQLGHALVAAHAVGVVHRDLKPENVFLARPRRAAERFVVKVLDFGIAKLLAQAQTAGGTGVIGTPLWMAPEQTSPGAAVSPAADLWSVGLIAFHALTGVHYWRTASAGEPTIGALMRELTVDPIEPASMRAGELGCAERVPPGFDAWFARCVERDPGRRFSTTAEAFAALDRVLRGVTEARAGATPVLAHTQTIPGRSPARAELPAAPAAIVAARTTAGASMEERVAPAHTSRRWAWIGVAIAGLALVAVPIGVVVARHRRPIPEGSASASAGTSASTSATAVAIEGSAAASASSVAPPTAPPEILALAPMKDNGGGTALIGAPADDVSAADNERPEHRKMIKAFFLDVTEVTVDAYARCVDAKACTPAAADPLCNGSQPGRGDHPINCVSALQAEAYCAWMGRRLPEEWEWEVAAGGLQGRRFPWGSDWPDATRACFGRCAKGLQTCAVGSFPRGDTRSGLKDLAGNVWEWTATPYCPYATPDCAAGDHRAIRGGGWCGGDASVLRTSARQWMSAGETKSTNVGFRCARTL